METYKNLNFRLATQADLDDLMKIYDDARKFMRSYGNKNQWVEGYPQREQLIKDMESDTLYVAEEDGKIVGGFAFVIGPDPVYAVIEDGKWINDDEYGTIHRIASALGKKGFLEETMRFCETLIKNIKIDTHADNAPMLRSIEKSGFTRCGIVHLPNGDPRTAFQKDSRGN